MGPFQGGTPMRYQLLCLTSVELVTSAIRAHVQLSIINARALRPNGGQGPTVVHSLSGKRFRTVCSISLGSSPGQRTSASTVRLCFSVSSLGEHLAGLLDMPAARVSRALLAP